MLYEYYVIVITLYYLVNSDRIVTPVHTNSQKSLAFNVSETSTQVKSNFHFATENTFRMRQYKVGVYLFKGVFLGKSCLFIHFMCVCQGIHVEARGQLERG